MKSAIRVRFAPSPTGPLHMGGVRTALYNYLFAKKNNGTFILRIEDTDQSRLVTEAEKYIIDALKWCGIEPEEGVGFGDGEFGSYKQSERTALYRKYADTLIESGNAYYAFDSAEELDAKRSDAEKEGERFQYDESTRMSMKNSLSLDKEEVDRHIENGNFVIRFKMPANEEIVFDDVVRDNVIYKSSDLDDKILLKADGFPTYHLANVVDDHHMKISHVIRGEEWLPSTPLHVVLYKAFGWDQPIFAHLPLILKPGGKGKLSKRDGAKHGFPVFPLDWKDPDSAEISPGYKEAGFIPEAFLNILALLGWHSSEDKEVFTLEELVKEFELERVVKSGARFDFEKAKWLNQQHLMSTEDSLLAAELRNLLLEEQKDYNLEYCEKVVSMMKERVFFLKEIPSEASYLFGDIESYDEKMVRKKFKAENEALYHEFIEDINTLENFNAGSIEAAVKSFIERKEIGFGAILPIIRLCVSGTVQGPSVFDIMELLGKSEVISRMSKGIEYFSENLVN
ncbi:MAG: glutamate--tRNA ligase [Chitinophagales bacterium]|nr:glutamate--tRNA ligase [Chitinophagales bacterium]